jgi:hypothetical protein
MAETVILMSIVGEEGAREMDVLHRNAKAEHFDLQFADGLLVLRDPRSEEQAELDRDCLFQWIVRRKDRWFTRSEAVEAMKDADAGLQKTAVYNRVVNWVEKGLLELSLDASGKEYLRRKQI